MNAAFRITARKLNIPSTSSFSKAPGTWRTKLASFCVGAALAGGVGYFRLQQDIFAASNDVRGHISATQNDVDKLVARIDALEKTLVAAQSSQ